MKNYEKDLDHAATMNKEHEEVKEIAEMVYDKLGMPELRMLALKDLADRASINKIVDYILTFDTKQLKRMKRQSEWLSENMRLICVMIEAAIIQKKYKT